jgi:2-oxoisovalerate dehydrogenase E2 component (dihydrolipoyl transacylase)
MLGMKRVVMTVASKKSTASVWTAGRRRRPLLESFSFLPRRPMSSSIVSSIPTGKRFLPHGPEIQTVIFGTNKNQTLSFQSSFSTAASAAVTTTSHPNRTPFLLADIGEGIKEVELLTWFVKTGDHVQQFDKICEVQSDKATVEITSRYDGLVDELAGNVGDMVQVGQPLLYLVSSSSESGDGGGGGGGSDQSSTHDTPGYTAATTTATSAMPSTLQDTTKTLEMDERLRIPTIASHYRLKSDDDYDSDDDDSDSSSGRGSSDGKFAASPAVRKLGKEYKLDLSTIHGSGPRGRLLKSDVLVYLQEQGRRVMSPPPSTTIPQQSVFSEKSSSSVPSQPGQQQRQTPQAFQHDVSVDEYEVVQLKGYNRLMVQSMTKALKIPHMGFGDEIIVDNLMACRQDLNKDNRNSKLSLMAFLCKACSLALTEYPLLNAASIMEEDQVSAGTPSSTPLASSSSSTANTLHVYKEHRLGIAMDTPRGLVVPVIRHVQTKSILEIQDDLTRFKELAAQNKLSATELSIAPTFTLSNIGALGCGGMTLQPVIVPPQVAMGAMGRIHKVPRYVTNDDDNDSGGSSNDVLQPVHVMHVTWAGDHRYLDGATLARFHHRFSYYLQHPTRMLLHLK